MPPSPAPLRMGGPANQRSCSVTARSVEVCRGRAGCLGCRKGHACMPCTPVQPSFHITLNGPHAAAQPLPQAAQTRAAQIRRNACISHGSAEASSEPDKHEQAEHPPGETAAAQSAACRCPADGSASRWPRYARPGRQPAHGRMQPLSKRHTQYVCLLILGRAGPRRALWPVQPEACKRQACAGLQQPTHPPQIVFRSGNWAALEAHVIQQAWPTASAHLNGIQLRNMCAPNQHWVALPLELHLDANLCRRSRRGGALLRALQSAACRPISLFRISTEWLSLAFEKLKPASALTATSPLHAHCMENTACLCCPPPAAPRDALP